MDLPNTQRTDPYFKAYLLLCVILCIASLVEYLDLSSWASNNPVLDISYDAFRFAVPTLLLVLALGSWTAVRYFHQRRFRPITYIIPLAFLITMSAVLIYMLAASLTQGTIARPHSQVLTVLNAMWFTAVLLLATYLGLHTTTQRSASRDIGKAVSKVLLLIAAISIILSIVPTTPESPNVPLSMILVDTALIGGYIVVVWLSLRTLRCLTTKHGGLKAVIMNRRGKSLKS